MGGRAGTRLALGCSIALYVLRLTRYRWLRQEWLEYFQQALPRICWGGSGGNVVCPICTNSMSAIPWHFATPPCCGRQVCWTCVCRHADSVIDDARPEMQCPLCRSAPLPDTLVNTAIRRVQWSFSAFEPLGRQARRKRRRYERWALSRGLAASCAARLEDVVHCPTEDCGHMWVLPQQLRRRKSQTEPRSSWNPKSWALGRHLGLYTPQVQGGEDVRKVSCLRCRADFCLLCGQPWSSPQSEHAGKSCVEHGAYQPQKCSADVRWTGARPCPGCSAPILRSWGCNHMTCTQCR